MLDVDKIKNDFPMFKNHPELVYLDNGATTFKPSCVIEMIKKYYESSSVNVERGDYLLSHEVSSAYEKARNTVAKFINARKDEEIVFTFEFDGF